MEITITGTNALTYPSLHIWNWMVAVDLFFGGLAAGLLIMSAIVNLTEGKDKVACVKGPLVAPFCLMIGAFFIWLDLERPFNFFQIMFTFQPSAPMSWGAWGITLIIPLSFLYGLSTVPAEYKHWLRFEFLKKLSDRLNPYMKPLARINFVLGVFLGIYTGILLSLFVARPLWNSALLPLVSLSSSIATGAALSAIIARRISSKIFFSRAVVWLLGVQLVIIALFFFSHLTSTAPQRESVMPFFSFTNEYFWYGASTVFFALLLPLGLVLGLVRTRKDYGLEPSGAALLRLKVSSFMVLIGGLIIRLAILYAGQLSKLA